MKNNQDDMKLIDLSHDVHTGAPVYPGDEPVNVRRTRFINRDGFALTSLGLTTHVGTHVDVAAHLFADAPGLDRMGPDNFAGWAAVVDCSDTSNRAIGQKDLAPLAAMDGLDFALVRTGWDRRWGEADYFEDPPTLSRTACRFLAGLGLRGVGLDFPSPDRADDADLHGHRILFEADMVIVENLCRLEELSERDFIFLCLPLRIRDGDGSPVRAVGVTL